METAHNPSFLRSASINSTDTTLCCMSDDVVIQHTLNIASRLQLLLLQYLSHYFIYSPFKQHAKRTTSYRTRLGCSQRWKIQHTNQGAQDCSRDYCRQGFWNARDWKEVRLVVVVLIFIICILKQWKRKMLMEAQLWEIQDAERGGRRRRQWFRRSTLQRSSRAHFVSSIAFQWTKNFGKDQWWIVNHLRSVTSKAPLEFVCNQ